MAPWLRGCGAPWLVRGMALGILLNTSCAPAPPALPLLAEDFTLAGVPVDTDSTEIRLTFGEPDSMSTSPNPFGDESPLVTWHYDGFEIRFAGEGTPVGYMIRARGERTARGLTVGDPAQLVVRLYGQPSAHFEPSWTYIDSNDVSGLRVVDLIMQADTVRRIYIGRAVD